MTAWAIDLDGVVWRGREAVPGSVEALTRLRESGADLAFVTNSAVRGPEEVGEKLAHHGFPDAAPLVITSAVAAVSLVAPGETVVVVGSDGLRDVVRQARARVVDTGPADAVIVGLTTSFDYDDITRAMTAIRAGARFVATNDDATFPDTDGLLPGNGSLVAAVATASGVAPVIAGKPHDPIVDLVRARLGPDGIMVGDRPETDGLFARALGYRFGLVLSGVVSQDDLPVEPEPDLIADDLAALVDEVGGWAQAGSPG